MAILAVATVAGCGDQEFRPERPMRAQSRDIRLNLEAVNFGRSGGFTFSSQSVEQHRLVRGNYTVATRIPCSGGVETRELLIDGEATGSGRLPPGFHRLHALFDQGTVAFDLDTVLDIRLEDDTCVRTPVVSQEIAFMPVRRWQLTLSSTIVGNSAFGGLTGLYGFGLGGGLWIGPAFWSGEADFAVGFCAKSACGSNDDGSLKNFLTFSAVLDVRLPLSAHRTSQQLWVPELGFRYGFAPIDVAAMDGRGKFDAHYFQAVVGLGMGGVPKGPFQGLKTASMYELAVPVGIVTNPGASHATVAFALGMVVRFFVPL